MNQLISFYNRFGVWTTLAGSFTLFLAWGFTDSWIGIVFLALGALFILADPVVSFLPRSRGEEARSIDRALFIAWGALVLAFVFFVLRQTLDLPLEKAVTGGDPFLTRLRLLLLALFLLSFFVFFAVRLSVSLGHSSRRSITESLNLMRRRSRNRAAASAVLAAALLVLFNYLTVVRNPVLDLSPGYFSFSPEARTIIKSLKHEVKAYAFLPVQQMVRSRKSSVRRPELGKIAEDVRNFLEQLPLINSRVKLTFMNADLDSANLSEFGVVNNGTIVFRVLKQDVSASGSGKPYIERRVYVHNERDMDKLEREVVRSLIQVSSPARTLYFTSSNGERYNWDDAARSLDGLGRLKDSLRFFNFRLKSLDHKNGWPVSIPGDADAVFIVGPSVPFGDQAKNALKDYIKKNGKLFISLAPDGGEDFSWLLSNNREKNYFYRKELVTYGYRDTVITDSMTRHRVTENLSLTPDRFVILPRTGYFEPEKKKSRVKRRRPDRRPFKRPGQKPRPRPQPRQNIAKQKPVQQKPLGPLDGLRPTEIVSSPFNAVIDKNRNGKRDKDEKSGRFTLGLAFEKSPPRPPARKIRRGPGKPPAVKKTPPQSAGKKKVVVGPKIVFFASIDWLTDRAMSYRVARRRHHNETLAIDAALWLTESPLAAAIQPRKRKSRAVRATDSLKFRNILLGMVLFPLFTGGLVSLGALYYRRKRKFIGDESE